MNKVTPFIFPLRRLRHFSVGISKTAGCFGLLYMLCFPMAAQTETQMERGIAVQTEPPLPENRHTTHATLFGIGGSSLYDTYLSPTTYRGIQINMLHETLRKTHWAGGRITTQSIVDGFVASTSNRMEKADEYAGKCNYSIGWHYNWLLWNRLRIMAGGEAHAGLGVIYNTRNSNNPVQAKAEIDVGASAIAIFPFHIRKVPFTTRYQFSLPLLGGMFSPQYGQSYYEISHTGYDHNICFTYPGNAPSMRHFLTLDFPIAGFTFRAGYLCDIRQSSVNGLKSHIWNHSFMVGYVKHFSFIKRKDSQHQPFVM